MTTLTQESAADGQLKQLARVASDAAGKAVRDYENLSKDGAQRVHGNSEFAVRIREATILALAELSATNQFTHEEVLSSYSYLSGYKKPVEIETQIDILRSHWPKLNPDGAIRYMQEVYPTLNIPGWIEGPFAIIRPKFFSEKYGEEIEEVFKALSKSLSGKFHNRRVKQMNRFRRHTRTIAAYEQIVEQQNNSDILVVGSQFGIRHRQGNGRHIVSSTRRAREKLVSGEFGLGAFPVGCMLLTHPNRLAQFDDLWLDCPGDEFDVPGSAVRFDGAPYFYFDGGEVGFGSCWFGRALECYGSVSGSVPKS